ncbi:hypothetical protein AB0H73_07960 [Streptomyces olivoreticuli]
MERRVSVMAKDVQTVAKIRARHAKKQVSLVLMLKDAPEQGGGPHWDKQAALATANEIEEALNQLAENAKDLEQTENLVESPDA